MYLYVQLDEVGDMEIPGSIVVAQRVGLSPLAAGCLPLLLVLWLTGVCASEAVKRKGLT